MSKKVAEIVADTILARMEECEKNGTMFRWIKPFAHGAPDRPYSYETLVPYHGINRLLLENNEYISVGRLKTYNQKKDAPRYQIRKGAKGHVVCYYNTTSVLDKETGEPMIDEFTGKEVKRGYLKYYHVFSREDIVRRDTGENLPSKFEFQHYSHEEMSDHMRETLERFNKLFNFYCKKYGIEVEIVKDGTQAYFSHDMRIRIPDINTFSSLFSYIHTVSHEAIHSSGSFLGRFEDQTQQNIETATQQYSREELIAEIGAELICNYLQVEDDSETPDNAISYIRSWSSYLKDRPQEILSAAAKAETACNFILECLREMELEEQTQVNELRLYEQEEER